jgi:hypothetical protein
VTVAGRLRALILAQDQATRNQPIEAAIRGLGLTALLAECDDIEEFRQECGNLYQRVRALFFLHALYRYHLPARGPLPPAGRIPFAGYARLLGRRFDEAVGLFLRERNTAGPSEAVTSALAEAYRALGFQTLADQVRRSVRGVRGNQWMFRVGHPADHPLRILPELRPAEGQLPFPILHETTPVRMDLSHSGWSDIFFLGMDYPEGARVLNVSIDLGVHGRDPQPRPPVEVFLRLIDEPVIRLTSVDLGASADLTTIADVFDFAKDYLGLLKAALIASGIVPPGLEGAGGGLDRLLRRLAGPGLGLEVVSRVNDIPKGSRLAVSTNLLAGVIAACMRATGQTHSLTGALREDERRLVAARAILGEWLGGSGGGWQDSGGVWPGIKLIEGTPAREGDLEYGVSRGCLLPRHRLLGDAEVPPAARQALEGSLVLVHGGMAQNVGPILEMVTEKYLLRSPEEWQARQLALELFEQIGGALRRGDVRALGAATTQNFRGPIQTIIPHTSNSYTELLIERTRQHFGEDFWGFWMLGGMSGGGMGFMVAPARKAEAQEFLQRTMSQARRELQHALPFAMEPAVYDFAVNPHGTKAELLRDGEAFLPSGYYAQQVPGWLRQEVRLLSPQRRDELERFGVACRRRPEMAGMIETLFDRVLPRPSGQGPDRVRLESLLEEHGFDRGQHERVRADLRRGQIGLAQNRLPASTVIEDVRPGDVLEEGAARDPAMVRLGREALRGGQVAVLTLAGGAGSRWTQGAGTVKALHPFCKLGGRHRTFLEVHLAKSRRAGAAAGTYPPHLISAGYLTHSPIDEHLRAVGNYGYPGGVYLSPGRAVGLRLVPMVRDLQFAWNETAHQQLDAQAQKVRDSLHQALTGWARQAGEGSDYTDNTPLQCLHPLGHWYEVPNLLRNGLLDRLLRERPALKYLLVHNVDTVGVDLDEGLLGLHIAGGKCMTFELIARRIEDRGGGLARVDGRLRLVEGLAMPRDEDEFALSCYNTLTCWIDLDRLLAGFGLARGDLGDTGRVGEATHRLARRMPSYVTLKDVKKRWGHGQEDVYPVCQFEKLWGDMTALPDADCGFVMAPRSRGQQLKDPAQLDGWLRDGSASYVERMCDWGPAPG